MIKTADEIYESMKALLESETGIYISEGGDMSLRLHSVALQLSGLWVQADFVSRQAYPQTAHGEYLDYHAELRALDRTEAVTAQGVLRFTLAAARNDDLSIAAGIECKTALGTSFVTTQSATINAGALFCDVSARAILPGISGNVAPGTIRQMVLAPTGVSYCSNPEAFYGGADTEDDESLRARILSTYKSLPNGANAAYYESVALNTDGVAAVSVLPKKRGIGTVDVIIAAQSGIPPQALLDTVADKLNLAREICVDIAVEAPALKGVDISLSLAAHADSDFNTVRAEAESMLHAYFSGERLGKDLLLAELHSIIYAVPGVANYVITQPAADISVAGESLPILQNLSISEMG